MRKAAGSPACGFAVCTGTGARPCQILPLAKAGGRMVK